MALTGQLSDLSLAELIEFFCNQRKTGRLKVVYPNFPGYFYIQAGALVDAKIGALRGVEAIYYALTLPNAEFKFSAASEPKVRTIYQPWTQVVLEGLRRMDEGISPTRDSMVGDGTDVYDDDDKEEDALLSAEEIEAAIAPLSLTVDTATAQGGRKKLMYAGVAAAVLLSIAAAGFPAGWYSHSSSKAPTIAPVSLSNTNAAQPSASEQPSASTTSSEQPSANASQPNDPNAAANAQAQKREREARERERAKAAAEAKNNAPLSDPLSSATSKPVNSSFPDAAKKPEAAKPGPKVATVTVTYDEAGRVTQASGSDATALRIARQKRFPTGKPGSTTITIPIN